MIVLDASALVEVLLQLPRAATVAARVFRPEETLHAPHLIDVEVVQVLRRFERQGAITAARGALAIEDLTDMPLVRYPIDPLLSRVWALRRNATAYDAAYLALAEALRCPLVTLDAALGAIPGKAAEVEVID